ncbi:MAG: hypothetical protein LBT29_04550 [Flavobacteriaceae bacterium]|jgi:Leucine-rich repeat (LRR) protein|nr:hypothetical protein [Flavobacteriaceae bacterium]
MYPIDNQYNIPLFCGLHNFFYNALRVFINNSLLTSIDVSKNTGLVLLACDYNQLTSLDVSKNTKLTTLFCNHNQLTHLDISKNKNLLSLSCDDNQLIELNIKNGKDNSISPQPEETNFLMFADNPNLLHICCDEIEKEFVINTLLSENYNAGNPVVTTDCD